MADTQKSDSQTQGLPADTRVDFVMDGRISLVHPENGAYRTAIDGLLLAACFRDVEGRGYDLGAGCGAVGFSIASTNASVEVTLVEKDGHMAACAKAGSALAENTEFSERIEVLQADVTARGETRSASGLLDASAEWVAMNPPYYSQHNHRTPKNTLRSEAFMLAEDGLEPWLRTASAILKPGGRMGIVFPASGLDEILRLCAGRYGGVTVLPIHSKGNEPAIRVLVGGIKGSRAPLSILPGLVINDDNGKRKTEIQSLINGEGRIQLFSH